VGNRNTFCVASASSKDVTWVGTSVVFAGGSSWAVRIGETISWFATPSLDRISNKTIRAGADVAARSIFTSERNGKCIAMADTIEKL